MTTQDLANWYVVFGAYANLVEKVKNVSISEEEERRMETLLQLLVGVLEDYNKVVRNNASITMHTLLHCEFSYKTNSMHSCFDPPSVFLSLF